MIRAFILENLEQVLEECRVIYDEGSSKNIPNEFYAIAQEQLREAINRQATDLISKLTNKFLYDDIMAEIEELKLYEYFKK